MNRLLLWVLLTFVAVPARATIHFIPIIDSDDPTIGRGCAYSYDNLEKHLKLARGEDKKKISIYTKKVRGIKPGEVVEKQTYSGAEAINFFRTGAMDIKRGDVVWSHFCGHGEKLLVDGKRKHYLRFPHDPERNPTAREDLIAALNTRIRPDGVKGVLLTTDTCSVLGDTGLAEILPTKGAPPEDLFKVIETIIGSTTGTVDITAASGDNPAFVDNGRWIESDIPGAPKEFMSSGGNFTEAILELLYQEPSQLDINRDKQVTWDESFAFLRAQTRYNFQQYKDRVSPADWKRLAPVGVDDQIPFANALGTHVNPPSVYDEANGYLARVNLIYEVPKGRSTQEKFYRQFLVKLDLQKDIIGKDLFMGFYFLDGKKRYLISKQKSYSDERGYAAIIKPKFQLKENELSYDDNSPMLFEVDTEAFQIPGDDDTGKQYVQLFIYQYKNETTGEGERKIYEGIHLIQDYSGEDVR